MGKIVASLTALVAAFSPAAAGVGKLHQMNSIHYPDFKSGGRQDSVKRKVERYYGKGHYPHDAELVANVNASQKWCERLLGLITYDKVVSVMKNNWNINDSQPGSGGGATRSSAFNATRSHHHIARGAAVDTPHYDEAAEVNDLINKIKDKGGFEEYGDSVEFLLLACTIYMVKGEGAEHDKIMSAANHNARCMYANFGVQVRDGNFASSKAELVDFREDRGEIDAEVKKEFRERTADGQTAYVLAVAESGAEELEEGHADRDKRCVGRLNATVAAVDAETLRVGPHNVGRFVNYPFHRWFLVVMTLHLGVVLPVETAVCEMALWA